VHPRREHPLGVQRVDFKNRHPSAVFCAAAISAGWEFWSSGVAATAYGCFIAKPVAKHSWSCAAALSAALAVTAYGSFIAKPVAKHSWSCAAALSAAWEFWSSGVAVTAYGCSIAKPVVK
jgi:hypothetical protein